MPTPAARARQGAVRLDVEARALARWLGERLAPADTAFTVHSRRSGIRGPAPICRGALAGTAPTTVCPAPPAPSSPSARGTGPHTPTNRSGLIPRSLQLCETASGHRATRPQRRLGPAHRPSHRPRRSAYPAKTHPGQHHLRITHSCLSFLEVSYSAIKFIFPSGTGSFARLPPYVIHLPPPAHVEAE